jgi:hypothetical protein
MAQTVIDFANQYRKQYYIKEGTITESHSKNIVMPINTKATNVFCKSIKK